MKIFAGWHKRTSRKEAGSLEMARQHSRARVSGNVFFALFAAVAMLGAVGYGFNTVLRGPIAGMTDVTRRTVAESTVVTTSRLAIVGATTHQNTGGDTDADGYIEPLPFYNPSKPVPQIPQGGGWLPRDGLAAGDWKLVANSIDPWNTEYGYCAWDSGPVIEATPVGRLKGADNKVVPTFVIISAGKNKKFETICRNYDPTDANADGILDNPMYEKPNGSDDIVLPFTYAEANDVGNGLWKGTNVPSPTVKAETDKKLEVKGSGSFASPITMTVADTTRGGGLILPDQDSATTCDAINAKQLRRNMTDPTNPVIEVCNESTGWTAVSGAGVAPDTDDGTQLTGTLISRWKFDELSGTTAFDSRGSNNGTLYNSPAWSPSGGVLGGALTFNDVDQYVLVKDSAILRPSSITISIWVKSAGTQPANATILNKPWHDGDPGQYTTWALGQDGGTQGLINFHVGHTGSFEYGYWDSGGYRLPQNQWVNLVAVVNPAATSGDQVKLYANGTIEGGIATLPGPINYDTTPDINDIYVGGSTSSGYTWNGSIDDLRIYNYALSDAEVTAIYNGGNGGMNTPGPSKRGRLYAWGIQSGNRLGNPDITGDRYVPNKVKVDEDFIQISAAGNKACAVKANGTVWCWGTENAGEFGDGGGTNDTNTAPKQMLGLTNVIKISVSNVHACALKKDGTIWCLGSGGGGALGNGSTLNSSTPVQVSNITDFIDVATNSASSCGVRASGEAWCWGPGTNGSLGNGTTSQTNVPVQVSNVSDFTKINGNLFSWAFCGVTKTGKGYCWGDSSNGSFGNGSSASANYTVPEPVSNITDFTDIVISSGGACGLRAGGKVYCWGTDSQGDIGDGTATIGDQSTPQQTAYLTNIVQISRGPGSACALDKAGQAYCWGSNGYGILGNGTTTVTNVPVAVSGGPFYAIAVGAAYNAYAIASTTQRRSAYSSPKDRDKLAVASNSVCAIDADKTAWCWGDDTSGQLGNGTTTGNQVSPSAVSNAGPWMQLAMNTASAAATKTISCGIKENGNLYCWGPEDNGGLGDGTSGTTVQTSPVLVGTTSDLWQSVSVGKYSACAIKNDNGLYCWGDDTNSNNAGSGSASPTPIVGDSLNWVRLSKGNNYTTCAIKTDGDLFCWGNNNNGITGTGGTTTTPVSIPTIVNSPGPWIDVSVGTLSACGIKANGTMWCWGDSATHRIGIVNAFSPLLVPDPGPWISVSNYNNHICGIKADSTAWCWGVYTNGQLGSNSSVILDLPTQVFGGTGWTAIKAGANSTCGMKSDNSVWCWGNDGYGQLGNGATLTADQYVPTPVNLFPKPPAFSYNANGTSYSQPAAVNLALGTSRYISDDGTGTKGLRLAGSGKTSLTQTATANQLLIDAGGNNGSAQLSFAAPGAAAAPEDGVSGLVSRWKLDETGGTTATDSVSGYNGTLYNGPTWAPSGGKQSGALTFDSGAIEYVRIPRNSDFEPTSNKFTLSVWVKRNGTSDDIGCQMIKQESGAAANYYISYSMCFNGTTGNIAFFTSNSSPGYGDTLVSTAALANNTWTLVTLTYDPSAGSNQKKIYINGSLDKQKTWTAPLVYDTTNTGDFYLGAGVPASAYNYYQRYFGSLDDARFYNRALSAAEILQVYNGYAAAATTVMRTVGLDYVSGNLEFSRNTSGADKWAQDLNTHDIEIDNNGNVGIGTTGQPMAKLDVNGAIRVGTDTSCSAAKAGTIAYNSGVWQYCNSSGTLVPFGTFVAPTLWNAQRKGSIVANESLGAAIRQTGDVWSWGNAYYLGNNTTTPNVSTPVALHSDSSSTGWTDWVYITTGCGVRANGTAWCWGDNQNGQLGNNSNDTALRPVQVQSDVSTTGWTDWLTISRGGGFYTCGTRANGTAWCWGFGTSGRLGNNTTSNTEADRPIQVQSDVSTTGWTDWISISVSMNNGEHTCGIRANGTAWCWGVASSGQLGDNQTSTKRGRPVQVQSDVSTTGWTDWVSIATGEEHTCGIRSNGTAWCWGYNALGQLGDNTYTKKSRPVQVQSNVSTTGWTDWVSITTGGDNTCGIRANGTAWCWGYGDDGELGNGVSGNSARPVQVLSNTGSAGWTNWVAISSGLSNVCGILADGTVWCWGAASDGQLGDGQTTTNRLYPVQVK